MGWKKSKTTTMEGADIEMTPMIDVVFQLLIYFVVTIQPVDVSAHLDVFRPSASAPPKDSETPPKMIQVQIHRHALIMNGRSVDMPSLIRILERLADISKTQTVLIACARDSQHDQLVAILNHCARVGMSNLSVTSMN